jgi:hypothetical protein
MEWGLAHASATRGTVSLPCYIFYHQWHCVGQLVYDHIHVVGGSDLSTDERHCPPGTYFCWPKKLLHFGHASPDRLTSYQQRACLDGFQSMVLLQQYGPLLQPLARPNPRVEILVGPSVELTP